MKIKEVWKPIEDYEGLYEVSNLGRVRSCVTNSSRRECVLKPHKKNGYLAINLCKNNICKHFYIHRLVAKAFIPNNNNLKYVNHIDCNKENNTWFNLEWCTQKQNIAHSIEHGLQHRRFKTIVDGVEYPTMKEASLRLFNKNFVFRELRYKYGNEFVYQGKKVVIYE